MIDRLTDISRLASNADKDLLQVKDRCVELLGDWQYAKSYFNTKTSSSSSSPSNTQPPATPSPAVLRAYFALDANQTILQLVPSSFSSSLTQFRVAALLNDFQFEQAIQETKAMHCSFPIMQETDQSSLRLQFFLTLSSIMTYLHTQNTEAAKRVLNTSIHHFSQIYARSARKIDMVGCQSPHLALLTVMKEALFEMVPTGQCCRMLHVLAGEQKQDLQNWFDILVFQKSFRFCFKDRLFHTIDLPHCSIHVDSLADETIHEYSSLFQRYYSTIQREGKFVSIKRVGYAWSKLLEREGRVDECVSLLYQVRHACEHDHDVVLRVGIVNYSIDRLSNIHVCFSVGIMI